jgi:predicted nucleotidyltransferase
MSYSATDIRLPQETLNVIRSSFRKIFGDNDELWLFGSRTDMNARGDDIDLFIKTTIDNAEQAGKAKRKFLTTIFMQLEEQKIDVIICYTGQQCMPIHDIAQKTGVRLV